MPVKPISREEVLREFCPQVVPIRHLSADELFSAALRVERLVIRPTFRRPDLEMLDRNPRAKRA